jgi:hypothetical protein
VRRVLEDKAAFGSRTLTCCFVADPWPTRCRPPCGARPTHGLRAGPAGEVVVELTVDARSSTTTAGATPHFIHVRPDLCSKDLTMRSGPMP